MLEALTGYFGAAETLGQYKNNTGLRLVIKIENHVVVIKPYKPREMEIVECKFLKATH